MRTFNINVGLETSNRFNPKEKYISVDTVLGNLAMLPFVEVQGFKLAQSASEVTLVANLVYEGSAPLDMTVLTEEILKMSTRLKQDCVAFYDVDADKGVLIGVYAEVWGEFNPEYFIKF